jgi:hypothetical protein
MESNINLGLVTFSLWCSKAFQKIVYSSLIEEQTNEIIASQNSYSIGVRRHIRQTIRAS